MKNIKVITYLIAIAFTTTTTSSYANVVGTDAQNFNSISSGLDFVTVQSSETLAPGIFNLGLFVNYAKNTLPYFSNGNEDDSLLIADMNIGYGLSKNWDIGVSFPYLLNQSVDSQAPGGEFLNRGFTEYRFNTKYRLLGDNEGGVAIVGSMNVNRIEHNPFVGNDAGPTFNLEVAADTIYKKVALAANIGHRFRNSGTQIVDIPEISPVEDQWIASLAASYFITELNLKVIGEIFGSFPSKKTIFSTHRELSSLEWLAGIKYSATQSLSLHAGAGTELLHGSATPDWRIYTGVNWTFGPVFQKDPEQPGIGIYKVLRDENQKVVSLEEDELTGPIGKAETFLVKDILFEFDSDVLDEGSLQTLDKFASYLKRPPEISSLVIEGHTDSIGSDTYNMQLSRKRALSVARYLVETHKIPNRKIKAIGYGESRPIADNGNYQGREQNRRVEFQVTRTNSQVNFNGNKMEEVGSKRPTKIKKKNRR